MAIIPSGTKFRGIAAGVETAERGSRRKSTAGEIYTIADINETITTTPADVTGTASTLAHYDSTGTMSEAGEVTVNADGNITSTADIQAANLTATVATTTAALNVTGGLNKTLATAPTVASFGVAGDVIIAADGIYICTVTGVDPTAASWIKTDTTAVT